MSPLGKHRERKKRLSGQYSSREQSAREGNDLEDSTQICCSVKHGGAECEGRLVEMEEVVVRSGWKKKKKTNRKSCGGNKYQMFYFNLLLPHMSTICIPQRNQTVYLICQIQTPPPHSALTCCTLVTCFSKELIYAFHFIETYCVLQMFIKDQAISFT